MTRCYQGLFLFVFRPPANFGNPQRNRSGSAIAQAVSPLSSVYPADKELFRRKHPVLVETEDDPRQAVSPSNIAYTPGSVPDAFTFL